MGIQSSISKKAVMAVTGIFLAGFLLAHMSGNLLVFAGRDALNSYAEMLKSKPAVLWGARIFLLVNVVAHVGTAIRITLENKAARPVPYAFENTVQASYASRTMIYSGFIILAFVIFHLAHYTWGWVYNDFHSMTQTMPDKRVRHDVYGMVVSSFQQGWISSLYILAQALLSLHLMHGVSSLFQSLGINHPKYNKLIKMAGPAFGGLILFGNTIIPLSILLGIVK